MKLNHLGLTVADVAETAAFLEKYFGLRIFEGKRSGKNFVGLFDDDGLVLTLMKGGHGAPVTYPAHFHIGFTQPSEECVNAIFQQLKDDGYVVKPPERTHAWTFTVQAPGGFTVEVLA